MTWRPWRHAWAQALYGDHGFYRTQRPSAHFSTSTTGIPGGAGIMAGALAQWLHNHGLDCFVDIGAGDGTLAAAMARDAHGTRCVAVEIRSRPDALPANVEWLELPAGSGSLPALLDALTSLPNALVLAHEWLDVVPCDIAERAPTDELHYVEVDERTGQERLGSIVSDVDLPWCERNWPTVGQPGDRVEIGRARDDVWRAVTEVATDSARHSVAIAVDYGHVHSRRPRFGSLIGYRHGHPVVPVPDGSCDITAQVAMDSLPSDALLDQRTVLGSLGIAAHPPDPADARTDPGRYLTALASAGAAAALAGPGFGSHLWAISHPTGGARDPAR